MQISLSKVFLNKNFPSGTFSLLPQFTLSSCSCLQQQMLLQNSNSRVVCVCNIKCSCEIPTPLTVIEQTVCKSLLNSTTVLFSKESVSPQCKTVQGILSAPAAAVLFLLQNLAFCFSVFPDYELILPLSHILFHRVFWFSFVAGFLDCSTLALVNLISCANALNLVL